MKEIFNNREIALILWVVVILFFAMLRKEGRKFIKNVIYIFLEKRIIILFSIFTLGLILNIYILNIINFWEVELTKDTILWLFFIEFPLLFKVIDKCKNIRFFQELILDNVKISTLFEFILKFWSFSLITEFFIVPLAFFCEIIYTMTSRNSKEKKVLRFLEHCFTLYIYYLIAFVIYNFIFNSQQFFEISTLKSFLLPLILIIMNLPFIYGFALHIYYEDFFSRIELKEESKKMKRILIKNCKLNFNKISIFRNNYMYEIISCSNALDLQEKIKEIEEREKMKLGDNYMVRSKFYCKWSLIGIIVALVGILINNSVIDIKNLLTFNFVFSWSSINQILNQIFAVLFVASIFAYVYAIGNKKKKYEELSQVKAIALHSFLFCLKRQFELISKDSEDVKLIEMYINYILPAYELKKECDRILRMYPNLLNRFELEELKNLQLYSGSFLNSFSIEVNELYNIKYKDFEKLYFQSKKTAKQNDKINVYTYEIENNLKKYISQVENCIEEFKLLLK